MFGSFDENGPVMDYFNKLPNDERAESKRFYFPIAQTEIVDMSAGVAMSLSKCKTTKKIRMVCSFTQATRNYWYQKDDFRHIYRKDDLTHEFFFEEGQLDLNGTSMILDKPDSFMDNNQAG